MKKYIVKPELIVSDIKEAEFNALDDYQKELLQYWFHKLAYRHPYQKIGKFMDQHFSTKQDPISSLMSNFKSIK